MLAIDTLVVQRKLGRNVFFLLLQICDSYLCLGAGCRAVVKVILFLTYAAVNLTAFGGR